jgi:hypothetical protein
LKSDLLEQLKKWILENEKEEAIGISTFINKTTSGEQISSEEKPFATTKQNVSVGVLRNILGELMKEVNEASLIYKKSMRSPSKENVEAARKMIDELQSWDEIISLVKHIKSFFSESSRNFLRFAHNAGYIMNILHYLERAKFSPDQVEFIRQIASNPDAAERSEDFPDEMNQEGLNRMFENSIYNTQSDEQKTLKVIREVLQNAVDATDPKQKPELSSRPGWKPEIHIRTSVFKEGEKYYLDIIVDDRGVGMNWDVLSKKFFVTFESGKAGDHGAAGGFGIAKALIQEAPKHGWSVDTNGIHSSRFHKNVFLGTRKGGRYEAPSTEIKKHNDGTSLSLYGMPYANSDRIKELCSVYATNGRVKIFLEGKEQEPKFLLDSDRVTLIGDGSNIASAVSDDESEREVAQKLLEKRKDAIADKISEIGAVAGGRNKYKFYLKKTSGSGKLYVMVNGQFQFDEEKYISKLDVIVSIETQARPGDPDYPLDPGREYLRGEAKNNINELVSLLKDFTKEMADDELFKDGIESIIVNEDESPMTMDEEESTTHKKEAMASVLQSAVGLFDDSKDQNSEDKSDIPSRADGDRSQTSTELDEQQKIDKVTKELTDLVGKESPFSEETIERLVKEAIGSSEDRVEQNNMIKSIVEGLSTPGHVLVQKNFVAKKAVSEQPKITGEMLIVWQKAIKIIIKKMSAVYSGTRSRPFVPGLIYSSEALGLYMPAKSGRKFDSICVNPVTMSAHILPKYFAEKLEDDDLKQAFEIIDEMDGPSETPINRLSKFIFHLAIHEVCHYLYPDGWSPENFHRYISKMERICHDEYDQIKREVKLHMGGLRKSAQKLITLVAKNRTRKESFNQWARFKASKMIFENFPNKEKHKTIPTARTFREFLKN